jgi:CheY-like chemotaxis protein
MPKDTKAVKASFKGPFPPAPGETRTNIGTILIVEDEPIPRRAIRTVLTRNGYNILEAADGLEALALWAAHRSQIELIFADMEIPGGLSGLQLCQRAMAEKPGLKVVITSGYIADQEDLKQMAKASILYLPKPCPLESLLEMIGMCLPREHQNMPG